MFRFFCDKKKVVAAAPKCNHGSITVAGYKHGSQNWINQDSSFLVESIPSNKHDGGHILAGVMDGHGENGHLISGYCKSRLITLLADSSSVSPSDRHSVEAVFETLQTEIENEMLPAGSTSGTTMTIIRIVNGCVQAFNVGDSPAYLARRKEVNGDLELIQLTFDFKPEDESENRRVNSAGGQIYAKPVVNGESNEIEVGPMRVWYESDTTDETKMIGLAMTRSIGDVLAHKVGVSSQPHFCQESITSMDEFIVMGSDGLTDALSPREIVSLIEEYKATLPPYEHKMAWDPQEVAKILVACARRKWHGCRSIDDITCCVIKLRDMHRCFFTTESE